MLQFHYNPAGGALQPIPPILSGRTAPRVVGANYLPNLFRIVTKSKKYIINWGIYKTVMQYKSN